MNPNERIKAATERKVQLMENRPSIANCTAISKTRLIEGLRCEIQEGSWNIIADLHPKSGGEDAGPNPGVMGRGALGACLAMSYQIWASRMGIQIDALEVEIQADYDARGMYGVTGVGVIPAAYSEVRFIVRIDSPAPLEKIHEFMDMSDSCCTFLEVFAKPQKMVGTRMINQQSTPILPEALLEKK